MVRNFTSLHGMRGISDLGLRSAAFMYTFGSAGLSSTEAANRRALDSWRIVPRMLRDASERNLNVRPVLSTIWTYH